MHEEKKDEIAEISPYALNAMIKVNIKKLSIKLIT